MRLSRHFAAVAGLGIGFSAAVIMGVATLLSTAAAPALAAAWQSPSGATAAVNPTRATPGSQVTFAVSCASTQASSATLFGTTLGLPDRIPMTKGAVSGDFVITVTLPGTIAPGSYTPDIDCSDGSSGSATLTVSAVPASGGAQTGDGTTSAQTNSGVAIGGLALIATGAISAGIAQHRRHAVRRRG